MQPVRVEQVYVRWCLARDALPFRLRWEPTTSPTRKGIGLEETDVAYRRIKEVIIAVEQPTELLAKGFVLSEEKA